MNVYDTAVGLLGAVICWENLMPAARMAMYHQGIELYCAPSADGRDSHHATMRHIAQEGRCFVLAANQVMRVAAAGTRSAVDRRLSSATLLVSDDVIEQAQRLLWGTVRLAVEPGGATALAASMTRLSSSEQPVVVLSGANVPLTMLSSATAAVLPNRR